MIECLELSPNTTVDWRSFCAEVAEKWLEDQQPIGGCDVEFEIDESMISRRKYHRGRFLSQVWLFGGVERVSKNKFVIPLTGPRGDKKEKDTLMCGPPRTQGRTVRSAIKKVCPPLV